jgi:GrpB-like predicted nucleotidyltransferase (UPF0157 family)
VRIVVDYDPAWPEEATREPARVADAIGGIAVRLDHVGSTSVPGLAAKPIVDLQVSVTSLEPERAYVEPLAGLGYLFVPTPPSPSITSSASRRGDHAPTTSMSARRAASKSSATSPSATTCAPTAARRRPMQR